MSLPPSSAPTATGWSDSCRAGFAPAEEWRPSRRTTTDCYRSSPAQSLARSLFTAVEQHAAGQKLADDLTVLVVKPIDADPPPVPDGDRRDRPTAP